MIYLTIYIGINAFITGTFYNEFPQLEECKNIKVLCRFVLVFTASIALALPFFIICEAIEYYWYYTKKDGIRSTNIFHLVIKMFKKIFNANK